MDDERIEQKYFFECESMEGRGIQLGIHWEFNGNSMSKTGIQNKRGLRSHGFLTCATIGSAPELAFYNIN